MTKTGLNSTVSYIISYWSKGGTYTAAGTAPVKTGPSVIRGLISGTIPTGGSGSYTYQWYSSTDAGTTWTVISGATAQNYTSAGLLITTWFRRTTTRNGATANSNTAVYTVYPPIVPADIPTDTLFYARGLTIVSGAPTGGTGAYIYNWQSSADATTWANISGATSLLYPVPSIAAKTYYRLKITSSSFIGHSNTIFVFTAINGGIISINIATIASGGWRNLVFLNKKLRGRIKSNLKALRIAKTKILSIRYPNKIG